jgi:hypothetical protein
MGIFPSYFSYCVPATALCHPRFHILKRMLFGGLYSKYARALTFENLDHRSAGKKKRGGGGGGGTGGGGCASSYATASGYAACHPSRRAPSPPAPTPALHLLAPHQPSKKVTTHAVKIVKRTLYREYLHLSVCKSINIRALSVMFLQYYV